MGLSPGSDVALRLAVCVCVCVCVCVRLAVLGASDCTVVLRQTFARHIGRMDDERSGRPKPVMLYRAHPGGALCYTVTFVLLSVRMRLHG